MKNILGGGDGGGGSRLIDSEKFIKVYLFLPMLCQLNKSKETMKKKKNKKKNMLHYKTQSVGSLLFIQLASFFASRGQRLVMSRRGPWEGYRRQAKQLPDLVSFSWHGPIFGLFQSWKRLILVAYC